MASGDMELQTHTSYRHRRGEASNACDTLRGVSCHLGSRRAIMIHWTLVVPTRFRALWWSVEVGCALRTASSQA
eukprot:2138232-Alexandrium_andersonii.AAC.1